jgi:S-adenosylmethionine synthetase
VQYENGKPVGVREIVVSHQHNGRRHDLEPGARARRALCAPALPKGWINGKTVWHINPTGKILHRRSRRRLRPHRPQDHRRYLWRRAPHGGGAFSGKDPTKVDRSAAYAARYLAKNVVAAGFADRCTLQLAYAIGVARPLSIYIDTHGTGKVPEDKLEKAVPKRWI